METVREAVMLCLPSAQAKYDRRKACASTGGCHSQLYKFALALTWQVFYKAFNNLSKKTGAHKLCYQNSLISFNISRRWPWSIRLQISMYQDENCDVTTVIQCTVTANSYWDWALSCCWKAVGLHYLTREVYSRNYSNYSHYYSVGAIVSTRYICVCVLSMIQQQLNLFFSLMQTIQSTTWLFPKLLNSAEFGTPGKVILPTLKSDFLAQIMHGIFLLNYRCYSNT